MNLELLDKCPPFKFEVGGYAWAYANPEYMYEESTLVFEVLITQAVLRCIERSQNKIQYRCDYVVEMSTLMSEELHRSESELFSTEVEALNFGIPRLERKIRAAENEVSKLRDRLFAMKSRVADIY